MHIDLERIKENKTTPELLEFGLIVMDKPAGPTSFKVANMVMRALGLRKTGHLGTLDPAVTGVLPVALSRACRLVGYFMGHDKEYVGVMTLHDEVDDGRLQEAMKKFLGTIVQMPPVRSRVKRQARERDINTFEIISREGRNVRFRADVQAGTYIRKLCHDLGTELGVGAHMSDLRRVRAGIFREAQSVTVEKFQEAVRSWRGGDDAPLRRMLIPAEIVSRILPVVQVREDSVTRLHQGKPVLRSDIAGEAASAKPSGGRAASLVRRAAPPDEIGGLETGEKVAVFAGQRFIEVARAVNEGDVVAVPEFVCN